MSLATGGFQPDDTICDDGMTTTIRASPWCAGDVRSAVKAKVSDSLIMELGRWKSSAWRYYLFHSKLDLQGACLQMWKCSSRVSLDEGTRVGAVELQALGANDDTLFIRKLEKAC